MTGWAGPLPLHCHCLRRPHRCRHTPPSPSPPPPFCRRQSTPSRPLPSPSCRPRRLAFVAWHRRVVAGEQCRNGSVCGVGGSAVGVTVTRRAGALRGAQKLLALLGASRLVLTSRSGLLWRCATRVGPTRRHCCGSCIRAVGLFCGGHDLWSVRCRRHTGNHLRRGTVARRGRGTAPSCPGAPSGPKTGASACPRGGGGRDGRLYCGSESRGAPRGRGLRRTELSWAAQRACSRASPRPTLPRRTASMPAGRSVNAATGSTHSVPVDRLLCAFAGAAVSRRTRERSSEVGGVLSARRR